MPLSGTAVLKPFEGQLSGDSGIRTPVGRSRPFALLLGRPPVADRATLIARSAMPTEPRLARVQGPATGRARSLESGAAQVPVWGTMFQR